MSTSTALATQTERKPALTAGNNVLAIVPSDAEQAFRMAQLVCKANMAPKGMEQPEKVVTAIMTGLEIGLKPMQALQSIAIVNGRPTVWGDAVVGLVMASGKCGGFKEWIEGTGDKMVAKCWAKRSDMPTESEQSFSTDDAKTAGLWAKTGPWKQYPRRMLQMRARAFCLRDLFSDVLKGLGVAEEVRDYKASVAVEQQASHERELRDEIYRQAGQEPPLIESPDSELEEIGHDEPESDVKVTYWSIDIQRREQKPVNEAIEAINRDIDSAGNGAAQLRLILQNNGWLEEVAPDRWNAVQDAIASLQKGLADA